MVELCLTLAVESPAGLQKKITCYDGEVPVIEVRLDFLNPVEFPVLPTGSGTRYLATCRPVREGGKFTGPESDRMEILSKASEKGFSLVDVESDVEIMPVFPASVKVVRSRHDFSGCPSDLDQIYGSLRSCEGDLPKLVVTPANTPELINLLKFMEKSLPVSPGIIFGMGPLAQVTRVAGPFLGCPWTYVSEDNNSVAPGQFGLSAARNLYRLPARKEVPEIFGVVGKNERGNVDIFAGFLNVQFREQGLNTLVLPFPGLEMAPFLSYALSSKLPYRGFVELESGKGGRVPGDNRGAGSDRAGRLFRLRGGKWISEPFSAADPGRASSEIISFWMA